MAVVGANQWRGGYKEYTSTGKISSSYIPENMEPDSYLGKIVRNCDLKHSMHKEYSEFEALSKADLVWGGQTLILKVLPFDTLTVGLQIQVTLWQLPKRSLAH